MLKFDKKKKRDHPLPHFLIPRLFYRSEMWFFLSFILIVSIISFTRVNPSCRDYSYALDAVEVSLGEILSGKPVQLPQNDTRIVKYVWDNGLVEPPSNLEYNLTRPSIKNPSLGQAQFVQRVFGNMTNGLFVEAGALDGETLSNSLYFERYLGWNGLLVEGDPSNYALVKEKNRKAWISNTCLAIHPYPHLADFFQNFNLGRIVDSSSNTIGTNKKVVTVQCMPLASLLVALNVSIVDYFSLDVEGSELQVLKTIPFDQVYIKILSVEFAHTTERKDKLLQYMQSKGYKMLQEINKPPRQAEFNCG